MKARFFFLVVILLSFIDSFVLASGLSISGGDKNRTVRGVVVDTSREPIIGANIRLKGANNVGTITDIDGNFVLMVPDEGVLQISYMGYRMQEVKLTGKMIYKIILEEDSELLDEVVVVGYGTLNKKNVSTAISSVKGDKINNPSLSDVGQALVGQVAGIRLQQTSGEPGETPTFRIRGTGSISSSNNPLYVIDGFPTNDVTLFSALSPADIESIDVLKDAAAAAIYGSRAGNGVVIVNTKKGNKGDAKISLDLSWGFENVAKKYDVMNAKEFGEMAIESLTNQGKPIPDFLQSPERWANTDWQDVIFRTALVQRYNFSVRGGGDKIKYSVSANYTDHQGVIEKSYMKRYNFRVSVDATLNKMLKIGANIAPSFTKKRLQNPQGANTEKGTSGLIAEALSLPPIIPVFQPNGDYFNIYQDEELSKVFNTGIFNPLNKIDANEDYLSMFRQQMSTYLSLEPVKNLKLSTTFNLGLVSDIREKYVHGFKSKGGDNTGNISTPSLKSIDALRENASNLNWYWSNIATYQFNIKEKHSFDLLLGYDVSQKIGLKLNVTPRTDKDNPIAFDNFTIHNVQGATLRNGDTSKNEYVFDALFARLNYNYLSKYLLSLSIRRDRSSKFGPNNRSGYFPALSAAWNISDESFMQTIKWLSLLKIRASYGVTGNDQLAGYYDWASLMTSTYYVFGGDEDYRVLGYCPQGYANSNLGWEKNKQYDFGVEFALFNNRISLSFDYYNRKSNTILSSAIPVINGKSNTYTNNVGDIQNRGFELTFNSTNIAAKLLWKTDLNISVNRNKILSLGNDQTELKGQYAGTYWGNVVRNYVGRPMGDLYMYVVEGTFNNEDDLKKYPKKGTQGIGDLRFKDVAGGADGAPDGKITSADMTYVGNAQPKFVYGITNSFYYGNFDLNLLIDGVYGGKIINAVERPISLNRHLENAMASSVSRWRSAENPGNGFSQVAGTNNLSSNIDASTRYLYDASFLRIRNVTLGYTVPQKISNRLLLSSCRLFLSAQNLFTFTKYSGYNPEANFQGNSATNIGVDQGGYPVARNLTFGISVNF